MTEPVPTDYDIIQDDRLDALDDLVTPYYQPPAEAEYSFPVVGQGISSEQYQLMSLAQGDGLVITDNSQYPYYLTGMPGGDSETNSTNRMVLQVASNTGRAESVIGGFYHVLYQDKQIEYPAVSTPTTYHTCITYDPRREDEPSGPVHLETYAGEPPRTHGRKHNLLYTVHREPNQLLTDASIQRYRQYVSPTISVQNASQLPRTSDVLYGTVCWAGSVAYKALGDAGWRQLTDTLPGEWLDMPIFTSAGWSETASGARTARARWVPGGLQLNGRVAAVSPANSGMCQLPSGIRVRSTFRIPAAIHSEVIGMIGITTTIGNGRTLTVSPLSQASYVQLDGILIPDTILETY